MAKEEQVSGQIGVQTLDDIPVERPERPKRPVPEALRPYLFKKGDPLRGAVARKVAAKETNGDERARPLLERPAASDYLPDGRRKQSLGRTPEQLAEMRDQAARIAVDMERGIYIRAGHPWKGGYNRRQIAQDMGYHARSGHGVPKCLESPDFERAVEWERIRRDATYRIMLKEALPQTDVVLGGLLREAQRRVLSGDVTKMKDEVVLSELRQYMKMKAQHEAAINPRADVNITINDFRAQLDQLPSEARETALELWRNQMHRLAEATKVVDGDLLDAVERGPRGGKGGRKRAQAIRAQNPLAMLPVGTGS